MSFRAKSTCHVVIVAPVVQRRTTTVKMKLMSNADLEDPAVSDDLLRQVGHTDMFECYVTRGATEENRFHLACLTVCGSS